MLPATLVTIASFLLKFCSSSPVYSMQPAYIIANIGTTGRNIRNLPCISRKSNERGVCMFAIDCLKANGTHLGTCIDRFYFGSCCHIEPMHDIVGNTIDTAIIPSREPPSRVSSTTGKTSTSEATEKTAITTSTTTTTPKTTTTTASLKPVITASTKATTTTRTTTSKPPPTFGQRLTSPLVKTTTQPSSSTRTRPTVSSPKPTSSTASQPVSIAETTEVSYKLTTFQTVEENTVNAEPLTTSKPPKPVKPQTTSKPSTARPSLRPSTTTSKPPSVPFRPRPTTSQKPTIKPRPQTTPNKPLKITKPTLKPVTFTTKASVKVTKPAKITTTKKPVVNTRPSTTPVRLTSVRTTRKPTVTSTTTTTRRPTTSQVSTTTRSKVTTAAPTKPSVATTKPTPASTTTLTTKLSTTPTQSTATTTTTSTTTTTTTTAAPTLSTTTNTSTTESNDLPVVSSVLEAVNGNPATNEIEQAKPLVPPPTTEETSSPPLVTWAVVNEETTTKPATTLSQEWMPLTTPDGWVLLPSLSTLLPGDQTTSPTLNNTENNNTSSERPPEASTSTTTAPFNYSTEVSSTTNGSSTMSTPAVPVVSSTITNLIDASSPTVPSAVNMSDFTNVCGRRMYPEARIVGGERATFGKWPWQISLRQWRTSTYLHKCGAALLNENWAITAAHCVDNVPPSDLLLRLGEHDLSTDNEPYIHQERRVQIVASHPQFDPRTFEYDLALLRFYEPVQFQPNIIPVCVPATDENFVGRTAHVTGWGRLYEDGPLPSVLQEVSVPVINNTVCESMYRSAGYIEHIPHIFICAGWRRGGFDSCEGDSGGPMVIQRPDKRFLLAGVISWGIGCAEPNQPGVYTRISEFRDWINQILQF